MDFWGEPCPKNFTTTCSTLNHSLSDYADTNRNLSLFYGCSDEFLFQLPDNWTFSNTFTCQIGGINGSAAFYLDESFAGVENPIRRTCIINVTLPVLGAAFEELNRNRRMNETISKEELEEALNMGFEYVVLVNLEENTIMIQDHKVQFKGRTQSHRMNPVLVLFFMLVRHLLSHNISVICDYVFPSQDMLEQSIITEQKMKKKRTYMIFGTINKKSSLYIRLFLLLQGRRSV